MYNPLALLNVSVVHRLLEAGCRWWVRQYYPQGINAAENTRQAYLVTYYNNAHHARVHYDIIKNKKGSYLYDTEGHEDRKKLYIAATQPDGFRIYISQTYFEWEPPKHLQYKLQAYVRFQLGWTAQKGAEKIRVGLTATAGDDFLIVFKYKGMEQAIGLQEFETRYL
jgi:hypothetical protein